MLRLNTRRERLALNKTIETFGNNLLKERENQRGQKRRERRDAEIEDGAGQKTWPVVTHQTRNANTGNLREDGIRRPRAAKISQTGRRASSGKKQPADDRRGKGGHS
ncbi:hypothetical protein RRG08_044232 [Elysia crispata]|uniref:Uncharacterized protein n=1 Tax=Elysia crispata TaxID=231223 RepID=A0AAE0XX57_9GAST|nr:hypothetical protein RRG08_044232 [Elysia crispata]